MRYVRGGNKSPVNTAAEKIEGGGRGGEETPLDDLGVDVRSILKCMLKTLYLPIMDMIHISQRLIQW